MNDCHERGQNKSDLPPQKEVRVSDEDKITFDTNEPVVADILTQSPTVPKDDAETNEHSKNVLNVREDFDGLIESIRDCNDLESLKTATVDMFLKMHSRLEDLSRNQTTPVTTPPAPPPPPPPPAPSQTRRPLVRSRTCPEAGAVQLRGQGEEPVNLLLEEIRRKQLQRSGRLSLEDKYRNLS